MADFSEKAAIVVGAQGIGFATARKLAQEGASVVVCSDHEDQVERTLAELHKEGLEVEGLRADATSSADLGRLVDFTVETYGGVDILINSAGVQRYGTVVDTAEEVWDEVLSVNLKGMYLASKHAIPKMRERGGGSIVNVSSVQAFASQRGVAAYTASKGGYQRPNSCYGCGPRRGEHKGQRRLSRLSGHADAPVGGRSVQGREEC